MENLKTLTPGEENLMQVIWNFKATYLKDILTAYPEPKPHQNTVSTFLKNLTEKNYLTPIKEGRINRYEVSVEKSTYKKELLKNLIEHFYSSNPNELLVDLMSDGMIQLSVNEKSKDKKKKRKRKNNTTIL